jgi:hypothetical protein
MGLVPAAHAQPNIITFTKASGTDIVPPLTVPASSFSTFAWTISKCDPSNGLGSAAAAAANMLFSAGPSPVNQSVTAYDQQYGLGSCDNGGFGDGSGDVISGQWYCPATHYVTIHGPTGSAPTSPLTSPLQVGLFQVIRNVEGTCRMTLPLAPLFVSFENTLSSSLDGAIPGFLSKTSFSVAQPQFQSGGTVNNNGFLVEAMVHVSFGPASGDLSVDNGYGFGISPTLSSTAVGDVGTLPPPGLMTVSLLSGSEVSIPTDITDAIKSVDPKLDIEGQIKNTINAVPSTLESNINPQLTISVQTIVNALADAGATASGDAGDGGDGGAPPPPPTFPPCNGDAGVAATDFCWGAAETALGQPDASAIEKAAAAAITPSNFTCDNSTCNFHPVIQAINVLPDRLEIVLSPNLDGTADTLTPFYTQLLAAAPGLLTVTANLPGAVTMSISLDCSTPPTGTTSGSVTTVFQGSTGLADGLACGGLAKAYWIDFNLTNASAIPGLSTAVAGSSLGGYWERADNTQHVFFISQGTPDVHEFFFGQNATLWSDNDLSSASDGAQALGTSTLDAYLSGPFVAQEVDFIDTFNNVRELEFTPAGPSTAWQDNSPFFSLSGGVAYGPAKASGLAGYFLDTPENGIIMNRVFYVDLYGDVSNVSRDDRVGQNAARKWTGEVMTSGGPARFNSPLAAYVDYSDDSQHADYLSPNGHVHELYFPVSASGWTDNDLTGICAPGPGTPTSPDPCGPDSARPAAPNSLLDGYWQASDDSQHVDFVDEFGHVRELFLSAGGRWLNNDLSHLAGASDVAPESGAVVGYWQAQDDTQHVNFIDVGGDVHELLFRPGADWVDNDLTLAANGTRAALNSQVHSYVDENDNSQHVNFLDIQGHVHELLFEPSVGHWVDNDLSGFPKGYPATANSPIASYYNGTNGVVTGGDDSEHVDFIDPYAHVREMYHSITTSPSTWVNNDLTALAAGVTAGAGSKLDAYWQQSDNTQHVNFVDGNSHIHELYFKGTSWTDNDLTAVASNGTAANGGSALDAYWQQTDNSQHVHFLDTLGHVHELGFFPRGSHPQWADVDLTGVAQKGTPAAPTSAIHGYWEASDKSQHVNFVDANNFVHELLFANPHASGWVDNNLSVNGVLGCGSPGYASPTAGLASYWEESDNTQHVDYVSLGELGVHELIFRPGAECWKDTDLTSSARGSAAAAQSDLNAYWQPSDNTQHVHFMDAAQHVHELIYRGSPGTWTDNDLTALSAAALVALAPAGQPTLAVLPAPRSPLAGYWQATDDSQHVEYVDGQGNLQELSLHPKFEQ